MGRRFGGPVESKFSSVKNTYKGNFAREKVARIRRCWACGEDHRANDFHNPNDGRASLLKHEEDWAYIAVEDVMNLYLADSHSESSNNLEFESDEQNEANIVMTHDEVAGVNIGLEHTLSYNTFLHSCGFFRIVPRKERIWIRSLQKTIGTSGFMELSSNS